jgi:hypothetical protein
MLLAAAIAAVAGLSTATFSHAETLGTSSNVSLDIHYNGTGPEVPSNISYSTISGAPFSFSTAGFISPYALFQSSPTQPFTLNLVLNTPTNTGAAPAPVKASNGNTHGVVTQVNADWAITDSSFGTIGNSVFRGGTGTGSSISFTETVTPTPTGFHLELTGSLATDGKIHWATSTGGNLDGTTNLNTTPELYLPNDGNIYFDGSFDYVTADDHTPGLDVYNGTVTLATTPFATAVPVPAAAPVGVVLLASLGLVRRLRRSVA